MSVPSAKLLGHYASRLKNADPASWDEFLKTFDAYTTEITVAVTDAPQDQVLNMQGRARQCIAMLRLFQECKPIN